MLTLSLGRSNFHSACPWLCLLTPFGTLRSHGWYGQGRCPLENYNFREAMYLWCTSIAGNWSRVRSDEAQTRRMLRAAGKNERKRVHKRGEAATVQASTPHRSADDRFQ